MKPPTIDPATITTARQAMIQPPPLPPLPPLLGLPHAPTLADHAEAWARENGLGVPARRAGRAWAALYRTWVDYAFAGLAEPEPEVIELPTTLRPPEFRLVPDFDPWDEDDIRHYGPGKPAPDASLHLPTEAQRKEVR